MNSQKALEDIGKSGTMKLDDIVFHKSVGAKSHTPEVMDLATGEFFRIAEGTSMTHVEVFAGKGSKTPYRQAYKFADRYGGKEEDWQHIKGRCTLETDDGDRRAEVHWSKCEGIGDVEHFVKKWLE